MRAVSFVVSVLLVLSCSLASAQIPVLGILGAGHPELHWYQLETEHFTIVYHNGLDSVAMRAAPMAEEVYRVVTTNLRTRLDHKVKIYISDNDEVKNAFAFNDDHIFIWLRGILDDMPYGIRSSGHAKWLRTVLTHEFTHIVVAHATKDWTSFLAPSVGVPRWFNEGLARFMEPDGFTPDLDQLLRVATVYDELNLGSDDDYFSGTMTYEAGQSFVRFLAAEYGDSVIAKILQFRGSFGLFDFLEAFQHVTKHAFREVYDEWHKRLTVYYASAYGERFETNEFGRKIPCEIPVILAARIAPDGKRIALIGRRTNESGARLYVMANDTVGSVELVSDEPGIEPCLSWYPDGSAVAVSKLRFNDHADVIHDLYRVDIANGALERLTTDGRFEQPDVSPSGEIVAVHTDQGHSDLVIIGKNDSVRPLTRYNDVNVQVYTPRFSPDGQRVAFSVFDSDGSRRIRSIDIASGRTDSISTHAILPHQPLWLTDRIAYTEGMDGGTVVTVGFENGFVGRSHGSYPTPVGGTVAWDYSIRKDSILATSFDRRSSVPLYWIGTKEKLPVLEPVRLNSKYSVWHDIHFPLTTRLEDSLPPMRGLQASSYNSLMHIRPLVIFPIVLSDKGSNGTPGTRWGLTSILMDPMQKHVITLAADFGDQSHEFGGYIQYSFDLLGLRYRLTLDDVFGFDRTISDLPYYQRTKGYILELPFVFHAPNSNRIAHIVTVGIANRWLTPHNNGSIFDSLPDVNHRPIEINILEEQLNYRFTSTSTDVSVSAKWVASPSDKGWEHWRFDLGFDHHLDFNEDRTVYLGLRGLGTAQFGSQIPQEYVGFTTDEVFERGFSPSAIRPATRLRGIRRAVYGDRLVLGNAELVFPDRLFSTLVPLIGAFKPAFVMFFDIGSVWYDKTPDNFQPVRTIPLSKTEWLKSYGVELRVGAEDVITAALGLGYELKSHPYPDWYFRVNTSF